MENTLTVIDWVYRDQWAQAQGFADFEAYEATLDDPPFEPGSFTE